jgi:hypothetical protein
LGEGGGEVKINGKQLLFVVVIIVPLFVVLFVAGGIDAVFDTHIVKKISSFVKWLNKKLVGYEEAEREEGD